MRERHELFVARPADGPADFDLVAVVRAALPWAEIGRGQRARRSKDKWASAGRGTRCSHPAKPSILDPNRTRAVASR
jgi:hypothetical protein